MGSSSLTRDQTQALTIGRMEFSHWATREVPKSQLFRTLRSSYCELCQSLQSSHNYCPILPLASPHTVLSDACWFLKTTCHFSHMSPRTYSFLQWECSFSTSPFLDQLKQFCLIGCPPSDNYRTLYHGTYNSVFSPLTMCMFH